MTKRGITSSMGMVAARTCRRLSSDAASGLAVLSASQRRDHPGAVQTRDQLGIVEHAGRVERGREAVVGSDTVTGAAARSRRAT